MTSFIWDTSHFDGPLSTATLARARDEGIVALTHKLAEGTTDTEGTSDDSVLAAARAVGIEFLGGYLVPRTSPSVTAQVDRWIGLADQGEPWWRTFPGWFWQIDLERWPYDNVPASVGIAAARELRARTGRWTVLYASHGQYGDQLAGWDGPIWNADYVSTPRAGFAAMYPGDNWRPVHSFGVGGWGAYSGQEPTFLQYSSSATIAGLAARDVSAYRGTVDQLRSLITGGTMSADLATPDPTFGVPQENVYSAYNLLLALDELDNARAGAIWWQGKQLPRAGKLIAAILDIQAKVTALAGGHDAAPVALSDADRASIVADLQTALGGATARLEGKVDELLAVLRAGAQAEISALTQPPTT